MKNVDQALGHATPAITRITDEVWNINELSLQETLSAQIHIRELLAEGFTITSMGTSNIPTAFIAEWTHGEGGAIIGFLPEYDALPALGNAAVPRQEPRSDGVINGHGCGHNLLGSACTGAAFALKAMMVQENISGTIRVYGCAAEETEGAKVYMARDGYFNDLDACLAWHPAPVAAAGVVRTNATNVLSVEFFGTTAHAGNSPWEGRSALDALELFAHGINLMREHVRPSARMHYIYESGGSAPNIVPDYARMSLVLREENLLHVQAIAKRVQLLAEGCALGTETTKKVRVNFGLNDILPNQPLAQRTYEYMQSFGMPMWSVEEQAFARACQKAMNLPEQGMVSRSLPFVPDTLMGGSSDVGDVSYLVPTAIFAFPAMPLGVGLHTWAVTACGGMSIGLKGALGAAQIMAAVGYDLMTDAEFRNAARDDFKQRLGDRTYQCALPADHLQPLGLSVSTGKSSEEFAGRFS